MEEKSITFKGITGKKNETMEMSDLERLLQSRGEDIHLVDRVSPPRAFLRLESLQCFCPCAEDLQ